MSRKRIAEKEIEFCSLSRLRGRAGVGVLQQTLALVERIPPPDALFERVDLPRKRER
jgi:hypothetical protein